MLRILSCGTYLIDYTGGFTELPGDLRGDLLRLVAWQYQNRGIRFEAEEAGEAVRTYPKWRALAANNYIKTVV
jgi:hypothetical protein